MTHHSQATYLYNDTKCFFWCLAIHHGYNINGLEKYTNKLKSKAESELKKSFKNGVFLSDIPKLEKCFDTSINIYSLKENDNAEVIYLSKQIFQTLYLNLYQNHFSYIKDFDVYAKRYSCNVFFPIFGNHNLWLDLYDSFYKQSNRMYRVYVWVYGVYVRVCRVYIRDYV